MNTEQKAREWLASGTFDVNDLQEAEEIITALLAEREALLGAVKYFNEHGDCLGSAMKIKEAITLCEKEHE